MVHVAGGIAGAAQVERCIIRPRQSCVASSVPSRIADPPVPTAARPSAESLRECTCCIRADSDNTDSRICTFPRPDSFEDAANRTAIPRSSHLKEPQTFSSVPPEGPECRVHNCLRSKQSPHPRRVDGPLNERVCHDTSPCDVVCSHIGTGTACVRPPTTGLAARIGRSRTHTSAPSPRDVTFACPPPERAQARRTT